MSVSDQNIQSSLHVGRELSSVYYEEANTIKQQASTLFDNKLVTPFQSLALGSQGIQLLINPDGRLVESISIAMKFPGAAGLGIVPAFAYDVISAIEWSVAGSQTYRQEGIQHFIANLNDCDSIEKRDELIQQAQGTLTTAADTGGAGGYTIAASTWAYAHIKVPWSNLRAVNRKKPVDTNLFRQPLRVVLYLRSGSEIYYINSGSPAIPTSLEAGQFQVRTGDFMNKSDHINLREMVAGADGKMAVEQHYYSYPFTFQQSFISAPFTGNTTVPQVVYLNGFRKGELTSIVFALYLSTQYSGTTRDICAPSEPSDVQLLLNGNVLYRADQKTWKLTHLEMDRIPCWIRKSLSTPQSRYYFIEIPLAQFLPKTQSGNLQHGLDVSNQVLALQMTTPTTGSYYVVAYYNYNASMLHDGQNVNVIF